VSIFFKLEGREVRVPSAVLSQCGIYIIANDSSPGTTYSSSYSNKQEHDKRQKFLPPLFVGVVFTSNSTLTLALPRSDMV
jgi:hypothetical protein